MALNNGGLEDAGREYYDKQFGARIGNIRKPGATPPASGGGRKGGTGGAIGGGVIALLVLGRIILGCAGSGSSSYNSTYTPTYNYTPPPPVVMPPPAFDVPPAQPVVLPPDRDEELNKILEQIREDNERRRLNDPLVKPGVPDDPGADQPNDPPNKPGGGAPDDGGVPDRDR